MQLHKYKDYVVKIDVHKDGEFMDITPLIEE